MGLVVREVYSITFIFLFKKGRPPKLSVTPTVSTTKANTGTTKSKTNTTAAPTTTPNKKGKYTDWREPDNAKHLLCAAQLVVNNKLKLCDVVARYHTDIGLPAISRRVLNRAVTQLKDEQAGKPQATATGTKSKSSLLNKTNKEFLQQTIIYRDEANNGMTRNKIFVFIQMLVGCDRKTAGNHYDYFGVNSYLN